MIHTHPTTVNALTCTRDGEAIAQELFGDDVLWVPYTDPGLPLAREIARAARRVAGGRRFDRGDPAPEPRAHRGRGRRGRDRRAVRGRRRCDPASGCRGLGRERRGRAARPLPWCPGDGRGPDAHPGWTSSARAPGPRTVVFDRSADAARLAATPEGRALVEAGPLTPDQIVYAGSWPLWLDDRDRRRRGGAGTGRRGRGDGPRRDDGRGRRSSSWSPRRSGVFATGAVRRGRPRPRSSCTSMRPASGFGALALGGVRSLAAAERAFIEHWEAESYRRSIDAH